jgi:hypothetical protein
MLDVGVVLSYFISVIIYFSKLLFYSSFSASAGLFLIVANVGITAPTILIAAMNR